MLSAFTARPIVELRPRDKFKIESILAYGDRLLVGLSTGTLRIYRINEVGPQPRDEAPQNGDAEAGNDAEPGAPKQKVAELLSEKDKFSKYKIEQLAIIKEANILVSLSNGFVSIHDLQSYELQEQLTKTRGASAFAVTSNIVRDPSTGVPSIVSRLAVAVKRRLLLWSWHDMELEGEATEIALVSSIKSLTWACGTKIAAGLSSSYVMVNVESQEVVPIVGPGSIGGNPSQESGRLGGMGVGTMSYMGMGAMIPRPLATPLGEGEMLLAKDINTHFINRDGEPLGRRQIPWRAAPEAVGYSYPYLLALQEATKGTLEVRNPETLSLLQSISLPGANLLQVAQPNISLAHAGKGFLVASERIIWRMGALGYDSQIDALVEGDQLDEAISLLGMLEDALLRDKEGRLREIKMRKAQSLFDAKKFQDSLDLFTEVAAPPERVIKLYPRIISGDLAEDKEATESAEPDGEPRTPIQKTASKGRNKADSSAGSIKSPKKPTNDSVATLKNEQSDDKSETASISTKAEVPSPKDTYTEKELKTAARALQGFLADVRRRLKPFFNEDQTLKDASEVQIFDHGSSERTSEHLLGLSSLENVDRDQRLRDVASLVDTTLFRTHMYATPFLVRSLFRIPNFCDPGVVMEKLEETERYNDLIEFLFGKRLHRQALERLQKFGQAKEENEDAGSLRGPARIVTYLQNLPPELIDLILEFAEWPLRADPELGMQIFTADTEYAETLPREKVLKFLERIETALALRYLEHVIDELNDQTFELHQRLLTLYFERLKQSSITAAEKDELNSKFLALLRTSTQYSPARLLSTLPRDNPTFYEARALVFSKMGQHKQALEIYVFKLHDSAKAEEYCNRVHLTEDTVATTLPPSRRKSTTDPENEQPSIYHILLGLYLNPPKGEEKMWVPAIEILARHGARLPASSTLELIPESLPVKELEFYFRGRIRAANSIVSEGQVVAGLRKVEAVRLQAALLLGEGAAGEMARGGRGRRVRVDEERVCGVCFKRLGGSVISVFPEWVSSSPSAFFELPEGFPLTI
jgi:Vam6/Vps39-like protein vacuolar protein sorting-associated protein 39